MNELLCVTLKKSLSSLLPWDIPWYDASHTVFFAALYGALTFIGLGLFIAAVMTIRSMKKGESDSHH
ncbi:MAG TPA: hypothetical protein DCE18_15440 [Syntrophobacteraceae bacterium]|nr:hypothetical protein [Syntrophobacteraceae bacterium]HBZ55410.1 hypothetical protein [Syntrophobacteraceae bacterium]